jgi:predicted O-linked N-acetylglucosamine transferase (SPINDLY family)
MTQATNEQALQVALEHHGAGRLAEAEALYLQIVEQSPGHADALHLLGLVALQRGQVELAIDRIERALAINPPAAVYHCNLGEAYRKAGQPARAAASLQRAIELRPGLVQAHNNLGIALKDQGRPGDAVAAYERAIALQSDFAEAHNNLGIALVELGRLDEAIAASRRAIALRPGYAEAYNNLGAALWATGRNAEAIAAYRRAIEVFPGFADAHCNLGCALKDRGVLDEAVAALEQALALDPAYVEAHIGLGGARLARGEHYAAAESYRRALALRPDDVIAHSALLVCQQYCAGTSPAALARAHAEWDDRHGAPCRQATKPRDFDRNPNRPLRLGFVSPDFRSHPVGNLLIRALENLDPRSCVAVCYATAAARDRLTDRFIAAAHEWHVVLERNADAFAERIRGDRIDILFDLSGHTNGHQLPVFARRPAPVQITWIGYVGTTGLKTMDYLIADGYHVPPGAEPFYCEKILRMPDSYVCFDPPSEAPAVGPLPALARGHVTFGSFNNIAKVTPDVVALWARIVLAVPESRLVLVSPALGGENTRHRLGGAFAAAGVDQARVGLFGAMTRSDMLAAYNTIDVALDTFPYSGGVTTCEALWMGVPVVTCPGPTFAGRHSLSHLSNVGLTETIAANLDDYFDRAVALANDLPHLAMLRGELRGRMAGSPLCHGPRFAQHLGAQLCGVWRNWCRA